MFSGTEILAGGGTGLLADGLVGKAVAEHLVICFHLLLRVLRLLAARVS